MPGPTVYIKREPMSKHLDPRVVNEVKNQLKALEPAQRFITAREAVAELEPEIRQAMARGYTLEEIAERIGAEIKISPNTLKAYLYAKETRAKGTQAKKTPKRRSA
jgi:DNA-binding NarL/FixJ family response regulator